jgi:uncharacterized membrane protein
MLPAMKTKEKQNWAKIREAGAKSYIIKNTVIASLLIIFIQIFGFFYDKVSHVGLENFGLVWDAFVVKIWFNLSRVWIWGIIAVAVAAFALWKINEKRFERSK